MKMHMLRWIPAALVLLVLPACPLTDWFQDWFGTTPPQAENKTQDKEEFRRKPKAAIADTGPGVVVQDGDTIVSRDKFAEHVEAVFQSQPGIEQYLQMMGPDQVKAMYQQIAQMLQDQHVMRMFVEEKGLDQSQEYQKNFEMLMDQVENQLANYAFSQYLQEQLGDIPDSEAKSYYQDQQDKEMFQRDPFIQQSGGVKAAVVKADSQKQADSILKEAEQSGDLKKAAREYEKADTFQDLGVVNQQDTKPSRSVVAKIIRMKDTPALSTEQDEDGSVYVIRAIEQVAPKYAPFEDVKDSVKDVMKNQRFQEEYQKKIDELRNQYNVTVDDDMIDEFVQQKLGGQNSGQNGQ